MVDGAIAVFYTSCRVEFLSYCDLAQAKPNHMDGFGLVVGLEAPKFTSSNAE